MVKHRFQKGNQFGNRFQKGNQFGKANKGKRCLEETKKKIGLANSIVLKGHSISPKTRKKISKALKNHIGYWNGKHFSEKHRKRLSEVHRGEKSFLWHGGKSFEPYTADWTETLRRSIRERDNYICQICGKTQIEELENSERKLAVHHIDYNKKNCNPNNLITLCEKCHRKTYQNRNYWSKYFNG